MHIHQAKKGKTYTPSGFVLKGQVGIYTKPALIAGSDGTVDPHSSIRRVQAVGPWKRHRSWSRQPTCFAVLTRFENLYCVLGDLIG